MDTALRWVGKHPDGHVATIAAVIPPATNWTLANEWTEDIDNIFYRASMMNGWGVSPMRIPQGEIWSQVCISAHQAKRKVAEWTVPGWEWRTVPAFSPVLFGIDDIGLMVVSWEESTVWHGYVPPGEEICKGLAQLHGVQILDDMAKQRIPPAVAIGGR